MKAGGRRWALFVLIALAGAGASWLMLWTTAVGPIVTPDSVSYLEAAQSLLTGDGFSAGGQPMTHFPPGYPVLLAAGAFFLNGNTLEAARLLSAVLHGVNLALLGAAVWLCTEGSLLAVVSALSFFLLSQKTITAHAAVLSEPAFIAFSLAALITLAFHVRRPKLILALIGSLFVGCAMATRYVGVALLVPLVCALLVSGGRPLKHKIGHTLLGVTVASLPLASWVVRNRVVAGTATDRTLAYHTFDVRHAARLIETLYDFVIQPTDIARGVKGLHFGVVLALFLAAVVLLHRKNYFRHNADAVHVVLPALCVVFFLAYVLCLMISVSFFDASAQVDHRNLLPAFWAVAVAGIALARSASVAMGNRTLWYGFVLFMLLATSANSVPAVQKAVDMHRSGEGYTARQWHDSQTIAFVESLPDGQKIYSNGCDVIAFLTGRTATQIARTTDPGTLEPNSEFDEQLQEMSTEVREGEAIVVYLEGITWRWYLPPLEALGAECGIPISHSFDDGAIYGRLAGEE